MWFRVPRDVDLSNKDRGTNGHGYGDNRRIEACKIPSSNVDTLFAQNIPPKQTSKRRAKSRAKGAVVGGDGHTVHGGPECAIRNWNTLLIANRLPGLEDPTQEDGRSDVRAGKL